MDFYKQVFGWQFSQLESEPYWLIRTGGDELPGINGAITGTSKKQQCVVNTITVPSLELTIAAIKKHGGKLVSPKTALTGIGWMAYFKDPEGHLFGALETNAKAKG
jgi:predicted enzyme related to lactoylglutathione lyase